MAERTPEEREAHEVYSDAQLAARGWTPDEIADLRMHQWNLEPPKRARAAEAKSADEKK